MAIRTGKGYEVMVGCKLLFVFLCLKAPKTHSKTYPICTRRKSDKAFISSSLGVLVSSCTVTVLRSVSLLEMLVLRTKDLHLIDRQFG